MAAGWYVLQVYSGYEKRIEKTIRNMIASNELDKEIVRDVKIPTEEVSEIHEGKKRMATRMFFPGYLLVELDLPDDNWKASCQGIRHVYGVTGFVGTPANKKPVSLSGDDARGILQKSGEIKGEKPSRARQNYVVGEQVKINAGPFESFTGAVEEVNLEKSKLRVSVGIFGRNVPVEVDMTQVERV
jgi:transcriptional antiterminator NusG